jgi:hypothetical protein
VHRVLEQAGQIAEQREQRQAQAERTSQRGDERGTPEQIEVDQSIVPDSGHGREAHQKRRSHCEQRQHLAR